MTNKYEAALCPLSVGPVELRNRIVSTAHQTGLVREHRPTPELVAYHRERARGGIGGIFLEATAVHETGLLTPKTLAGYVPDAADGFGTLAEAIHAENASLFVQLFHGGREQIASAPRPPAVGPSAVPSTRFHVEPRALSLDEINSIIAGYAKSARAMLDAGLDGVEVSASHAYLPSQFFARRSNRRADQYGPENPLKFLDEVLAAIRAEVGDKIAVGVRLALDEMSDSGLDETACLELAGEVEANSPIDFVSYTMGDSATFSGGAYIAPRPRTMPESILSRLDHRENAGLVRIAASRVLDLAEASSAIASGVVDAVGMTRAQIAEPHLVRKAIEGEPSIPCIGCNVGCIGHYHAGVPIACIMNQATGRETSLPQPTVRRAEPHKEAMRVAVVGGGVAGMSAAAEAAGAGHRVVVFEQETDIGGQLRIAGKAPDHSYTWQAWRTWQQQLIHELGIEVRCGESVSMTELPGFDKVIDARGAVQYRDQELESVTELDGIRVMDAWEFLENPTGEVVLVSDWGGEPTGLDCVEVALQRGSRVHYAFAGDMPAVNIHQYQRFGYLGRIDVEDCTLHPATQLALGEGGKPVLRGSFSDRDRALPNGVDTIIIAHGRIPVVDPEAALGVRVGDLDGPRTLEEAALEGFLAARSMSAGKQ